METKTELAIKSGKLSTIDVIWTQLHQFASILNPSITEWILTARWITIRISKLMIKQKN